MALRSGVRIILPVVKPCWYAKWVIQVMSGYFCRNSILLEKSLSKIGYCLAILAISLFGLNGGPIDNKAVAKAKYFSGKTNHSRGYQRSGRKHIRNHHNATRHYQSGRVKHRRNIQKRHRSNYRQARRNRHGIFNLQPSRYRGPSVINVHKVLTTKKARKSRARYRQHNYRRHHRGLYSGINRVAITNPALIPQTNLYQHIERDDATGVSVIYFDKDKCDQGYDCVMRLGAKRSSAKIIVVGTKQRDRLGKDQKTPKIIYPPN